MNVIIEAVEDELKGSGTIICYRAMHQRLTHDHHLVVMRNIVRQMLKIHYADGVEARSRHRLRKRKSSPNQP